MPLPSPSSCSWMQLQLPQPLLLPQSVGQAAAAVVVVVVQCSQAVVARMMQRTGRCWTAMMMRLTRPHRYRSPSQGRSHWGLRHLLARDCGQQWQGWREQAVSSPLDAARGLCKSCACGRAPNGTRACWGRRAGCGARLQMRRFRTPQISQRWVVALFCAPGQLLSLRQTTC